MILLTTERNEQVVQLIGVFFRFGRDGPQASTGVDLLPQFVELRLGQPVKFQLSDAGVQPEPWEARFKFIPVLATASFERSSPPREFVLSLPRRGRRKIGRRVD